MEHLSIDDFIRVEEHLKKKLDEACVLFKKLIVTKTSNERQLSSDKLERIDQEARQQVKDIFEEDCLLLGEYLPDLGPMIIKLVDNAMKKMNILHDSEWQILASQLP